MIKHEQKFLEWIEKNKIGSSDQNATALKSLKSVSILIGDNLSEKNLFDEKCIENISKKLRGLRSEKSILNHQFALRQYVRMIEDLKKQIVLK
ncbi:MAG: hypothetical protein CVU08_07115 [Bacteroidetes bacterium HGW-Bacteroidetes-3]|jgi:hypothetical protein|nr:MAG: hypothetical protein CVU08_07115 [Bacteroidetes bacterium HGW-Bacteroidetes-3]